MKLTADCDYKKLKAPEWFEDDAYAILCNALVPIFDMINHSHKPNVIWSVDEEVWMNSSQLIGADEEIFIDYGASTSTQAKRVNIYGFTLGQKADEDELVEFSIKEVEMACQNVSY